MNGIWDQRLREGGGRRRNRSAAVRSHRSQIFLVLARNSYMGVCVRVRHRERETERVKATNAGTEALEKRGQ